MNSRKYSRNQIKELRLTYSAVEEITDSYQKLKSLFAIGTLLGTVVAVAMNAGLPDEAFERFIQVATVTPIIALVIGFKILNKFQNEDIYDYLEDLNY